LITTEHLLSIARWAHDLSPSERERAAKGIVERGFAQGEYICHQGDRFDCWSGVVSGLVKVSAVSDTGKAVTFTGVPAGGWFGEGTLLKDEQRKYDLVAIRATRLAMMNRATFLWLFDNSVAFNRFLVHQLNERLGQFIAVLGYDRMLDAQARLARGLAWMFNPVLYPSVGSYLDISQEELGLLSGLSRQMTNKCLRALEDEGLLKIEHSGVRIVDLRRLARYGE
jgi:cAMP-binding proteins - catabolite gene activator and regulatory subunit of cAMP-dependent protein kinases